MIFEFKKEIFYDDKNIINCPYCNIIIFYVNNSCEHECFMKNNEKFVINETNFKNFLCNINKINNKCIKHNNNFYYYKNSNYYCNKCLEEKKNLNDFIILENIKISNKEINNFFDLIKKFENILAKINNINEDLILKTEKKFIEELKKSYKKFVERNILLINFCKSLIKLNLKFEKNFNLISTIRRISIDFELNKLKKKNNKNLIDFYNENNIITFNNDLKYEINNNYYSYFSSENIFQNGKYYLGNKIDEGKFSEVYNALLIKDKKLVAIKKLIKCNNIEFENEKKILILMSKCKYSVKYIDSFEEKNNKFIVTELCNSNLKSELLNKKNGFCIDEIKEIFCQLNVGIKYLLNEINCIQTDLKPNNILIDKITKKK